jgi:hypothetical protein
MLDFFCNVDRQDRYVCDDGILIQLLCSRTLPITTFRRQDSVSGRSGDRDQLRRLGTLHLKTETESSLRNVVCLNKIRTMGNVQKHDN